MPVTSADEAVRLALEKLTAKDLVQATLKRGGSGDAFRVSFRPVSIKEVRKIQVSTFDGQKTEVKNYSDEEFPAVAESLLSAGFRSLYVGSATEETQIQFSKKGKPLISRKKRTAAVEPALQHDRTIQRLLPEGEPDPFLQGIGLMTTDGRIKADRRRKFQQINEFIRVVIEIGDLSKIASEPLLIVDFGCGNAYLTFALHYYLNQKMGVKAELIGVDHNPESVARDLAKAAELGAETICFETSDIKGFQAPRDADVVVALHACDTATDQALAKALEYQAKLIFSAPCCHHHLQAQMSQGQPAASYAAIVRDGILKERLGDIVTDTLRAMILRIAGYKVDVIEFTSPEHTAKNLLIRARKVRSVNVGELVQEYRDLKQSFGVTPYLESIVPDDVRALLS